MQLSANLRNLGQTPIQARLSFYEGDPDRGGFLIGELMQVIPSGSMTLSVAWTPADERVYDIFAVVENLSFSEAVLSNNRASLFVSVGAPADRVEVEGSTLTVWPDASFSAPVTFTNTGSAATQIQALSLSHPWASGLGTLVGATLAPGQTLTGLVQIDVPASAQGAPIGQAPVVLNLPIALQTPANTFSDEVVLGVLDQPASRLNLQILDVQTMAPVSGALVSVQGLPGSFTSDAAGLVVLDVATGPQAVFAYHPAYVAQAISVPVSGSQSSATMLLEPGNTLSVASVTTQPLSTAEIIARGVSISDPVNNVLVDFVVAMRIVPGAPTFPVVLPSVEIPNNPPAGTSYGVSGLCFCGNGVGNSGGGGGGIVAGSGGVGGVGGGYWVSGTVTATPHGNTGSWIIIPGTVTILKQFYEVIAFISNDAVAPAPEDIQLQNVDVTLALPSGLGLPDLNGQAQSLTASLGTLDAGESASANWIVRGDLPGSYTLAASSSADLVAFGSVISSVNASALSGSFEVTLPQVRLGFITPSNVVTGQPFLFGVSVTNEQVVDAQLVRVGLDVPNLVNCSVDPVQPSGTALIFDASNQIVGVEAALGDIPPGESRLAEFSLISALTGVVAEVRTTVSAAPVPKPNVVVAALYPGNDGDFRLRSGVQEPVNDLPVKVAHPGQNIELLFESPAGSLVGQPFAVVMQPKSSINFSGLPFPRIWVDFGPGFVFLIDGLSNGNLLLPSDGFRLQGPALPALAGQQLMVQGVAIDPLDPSSLGISDAHELRIEL